MSTNLIQKSATDEQALLVLSRFTLEITEASCDQEIFRILANQLPKILPADRCSVALLTADNKMLEVFALHGQDGALSLGQFLPIDQSFSGEALLYKKTFIRHHFHDSDKIDAQLLYQNNIKSVINAPLEDNHGVIGTLNIGSSKEVIYNQHSLEMMTLVAKIVSSCLERIHLLNQAELGIRNYKTYSHELEELASVAQQLATVTDVDDVFMIIAKSISQIVDAQRISYAVLSDQHASFSIKVIKPHQVNNPPLSIPIENSALGEIYNNEKGAFFNDFSTSPYLDHQLLSEFGFKSSWTAPVKINGEVIALLNAASVVDVKDGYKKLSVLNMLSGLLGVTLSRIKLQTEIEYQASFDQLTGLPNRHQLNLTMCNAIDNKVNKPFTVLFIDLDRFKTVNDTLGHAIGDKLLTKVTTRIQQQIRKDDFCCRHGGDEFVVILNDCESIDIAQYIAEKIIKSIKLPFIIDTFSLHIGASVGLSRFPFDSSEAEKLLEYADIAMYLAKQSGRNKYQLYSNKFLESIEYRQNIDRLLRLAIEKNELYLVYQPLLSNDKVIGVEALIRWESELLGSVPPDVFIPIAEESLLIEDITAWVLAQSIATIKTLRVLSPNLFIAVNISAKDCLNAEKLKHHILSLLHDHELPGHVLELEITENVLIDDIAAIQTLFKDLQSHGVRFAVDDFGTGFSSLTYLLSLPFDTIKIDQSFIKKEDKVRLGLVKGIIDIAASLSMHCLAEGIEKIEQKENLQDLGCFRFQGYYFSRPLLLNDLKRYLLKPKT